MCVVFVSSPQLRVQARLALLWLVETFIYIYIIIYTRLP